LQEKLSKFDISSKVTFKPIKWKLSRITFFWPEGEAPCLLVNKHLAQ
jgi:hypothetical protein